jgi:branched-chain amino acid transport system permease protein
LSLILVQVIVSGLLIGAVYALLSSGLTLIWGMMNVINFAHGDFVMLGMYTAFVVAVSLHGGPLVFTVAAFVVLFVLGVAVYYGLIRAVLRGPMLGQILSTFGLALVVRYTAFWLFSANVVTLPENIFGGTLDLGGIYLSGAQLVAGIVALALTAGMYLLLAHTRIGSQLLAVAEDRDAAMLMGIRPDRMQALAWGLASGAAGIAGALLAAIYPISPTIGETLAVTAFVVVTLGGFGSVPGALIAGLAIGIVQSLSAFWFGPIYRDVAVYSLFVLMLWVRPQGLMGTA